MSKAGGRGSLGLLRLVAQNLRRNKKNFIFSSFGIVVGISTFIFFMGLSWHFFFLTVESYSIGIFNFSN